MMTWPFENDTGAIVKKLAKRSLASEKRRNLMVVIAVALAAFLISFAAILSVSVAQIQRGHPAFCGQFGAAAALYHRRLPRAEDAAGNLIGGQREARYQPHLYFPGK